MISIGIVQQDIIWEDVEANLNSISGILENAGESLDLILLPELFTTGFTMRTGNLAEPMEGKTMTWMASNAGRFKCHIAGSIIIEEDGEYHNRMIWMQPDRNYRFYDKRHLFRMSGEHESYSAGREPLILDLKGFRFRPLICYDLRFPVWSRNRQDYDVLIYIANWPAARRDVWRTLLKARAIENQSYVIGVNRVGKDGTGIHYHGDTLVFDARGQVLVSLPPGKPMFQTVWLSLEDLQEFRAKFPAWQDADPFTLGS